MKILVYHPIWLEHSDSAWQTWSYACVRERLCRVFRYALSSTTLLSSEICSCAFLSLSIGAAEYCLYITVHEFHCSLYASVPECVCVCVGGSIWDLFVAVCVCAGGKPGVSGEWWGNGLHNFSFIQLWLLVQYCLCSNLGRFSIGESIPTVLCVNSMALAL